MKIIFYDINLLNLKKYIGDIICRMIDDESNYVVLLYDEFSQEGYDFYKDKNCKIIKNKAVSFKSISRFLEQENPDLLMVNAQRLSDTAFVSVAKKMCIKTVMIQHGMYIPFLKRERFFLIKKILKTIKYFFYSQVIAAAIEMNGIEVFRSFFATFVKGKVYKDVIDFTSYINVDFVLVYGEYWKKYHHEIFGYSFDSQYVIGYHELNRVDAILAQNYRDDAICYIAQTLVEDGRIVRQAMTDFLAELSKCAGDKKVFIKLHPRSDISLYSFPNFELSKNDIINCGLYVGHYSSMIALVGSLKGKVILYELPGHVIPDYFKEFSSIVDNADGLKAELLSCSDNTADNSEINYYFARGYETDRVVTLITKLSASLYTHNR